MLILFLVEMMELHLWKMKLNFIKMTNNQIGFGKKLIWKKIN